MSNYRDDTQETVTISSSSWGRTRETFDDTVKIATVIFATITATQAEAVAIEDRVIDRLLHVVSEQVTVSDSYTDQLSAISVIQERAKIADRDVSSTRQFELVEESLTSTDMFQDKILAMTYESASAKDTVSGRLYARTNLSEHSKISDTHWHKNHTSELVAEVLGVSDELRDSKLLLITDTLKVSDSTYGKHYNSSLVSEKLRISDSVSSHRLVTDIVEETAALTDSVQERLKVVTTESLIAKDTNVGTLKARTNLREKVKISAKLLGVNKSLVEESLHLFDEPYGIRKVFDEVLESAQLNDELIQSNHHTELVQESVVASDYSVGILHAQTHITDIVLIDDEVVGENVVSDWAWTANTDTWGTSRYSDYPYECLVVIDGVLYGSNASGVYALDSNQELDAKVSTAKIDLGEGALVHPNAAYLEYALSGDDKSLSISVGTSQSGDQNSYTYRMVEEKADYLTNGRVLFGRGLRGRHFSFELSIRAEAAQINDLSVDFTKTKRRI